MPNGCIMSFVDCRSGGKKEETKKNTTKENKTKEAQKRKESDNFFFELVNITNTLR